MENGEPFCAGRPRVGLRAGWPGKAQRRTGRRSRDEFAPSHVPPVRTTPCLKPSILQRSGEGEFCTQSAIRLILATSPSGPKSEVGLAAAYFRCTPQSRHPAGGPASPFRADFVAVVEDANRCKQMIMADPPETLLPQWF